MKHSNISVFIPHNGCPHQCSFCNQKSITGQAYQPTAEDVRKTLRQARLDLGERAKNAEIAFFGGSFTAIDREYMISLLDEAREFEGVFSGIRISTRPDAIDAEILALLKEYGVAAIELGAQSMDDHVLTLNERGHSAEDVRTAS
ncbi:MAG: radical SAM protein, partial [Ruminococcus sp.]|nr:radical SAM protein [Ruminococcus sp.]